MNEAVLALLHHAFVVAGGLVLALVAIGVDGLAAGFRPRTPGRTVAVIVLLLAGTGAVVAAVLVGAFEAQLEQVVLLAFFVPAVVYMADAVGTQTETLLIRGMSASIDMRTVVRRELITGVLVGGLIGLAFFPFALIGWGDADVALAVGLALAASCSIATSVATVLPRLLSRFGSDPAFGSGPLATIVQDLLSIAVYLAIATPIAT